MNPHTSDTFDVPAVDIGPYVCAGSDADRIRVAREIDDACTRVGFVQIFGHGIPDDVLDGLAGAVDDFFGLSLDEKKQYRVEGANRGYSPPKSEALSLSLGVESASKMNDFFEAFNVGTEARSFADLDLSEDDYGSICGRRSPASRIGCRPITPRRPGSPGLSRISSLMRSARNRITLHG